MAKLVDFWEGCELLDGPACSFSGALYLSGKGVPRDYSRAIVYFTKGCELNDANSCAALSKLAEIGLGGGAQWR